MPTDVGERVAKVEADMETIKGDLSRHRAHISDLLTFKSRLEGGMTTVKWMTGLGIFSNLIIIFKIFLG